MLPPQIPHLVDTSVHVELSGDKGMEVGKMGGFLCLPAHAEQYPLLARNGRQIPEPRYGALSDHSPKEGVAPSYGLAGLIYGVGKKFVSQKHAMTGDIIMTHPGPKNIGSSRPHLIHPPRVTKTLLRAWVSWVMRSSSAVIHPSCRPMARLLSLSLTSHAWRCAGGIAARMGRACSNVVRS